MQVLGLQTEAVVPLAVPWPGSPSFGALLPLQLGLLPAASTLNLLAPTPQQLLSAFSLF